MTTSTLHIVFCPSAAGSLTKALHDAGRKDRVVCHFDNLSLGPINPPDPPTRLTWLEQQLGYTDFEYVFTKGEAFWKEALSEEGRKAVWVSRRSAPEYTGFLEWLWRVDKLPCEVVDLTDMTVVLRRKDGNPTRPVRALSLALLSPEEIIDNRLFDRAELLGSTARDQYHSIWRRLRAEDAPLRVVNTDGLVSAPITFFDPLLLSCAQESWQKAARVVGEALAKWSDDALFQAGDLILSARIIALVELGVLEGRGNLMNIQQSEVRLPNQAPEGDAINA